VRVTPSDYGGSAVRPPSLVAHVLFLADAMEREAVFRQPHLIRCWRLPEHIRRFFACPFVISSELDHAVQ
jgi:hypothetical protein